ncbi:NERD domain-containing protein [Brucella sp. HL-2]|nr:NERD domain-containing protein [Brucella sp. HL-2]MCV9910197.1 NERD domain-containing protein [Brucella sp. HL-2]
MPAYRSEAEGEVRQAVVEYIRIQRPNARIIHEINSSFGGTRIDVLAVDRAEIIAFEIKSAKDKLDRLLDQMKGMKGVAHHAIAVLHEKFLSEEYVTNPSAAHYEREGVFYLKDLPGEYRHMTRTWIYPQRNRAMHPNGHDSHARWPDLASSLQKPLPATSLYMLHHAELLALCNRLQIHSGKRPTCEPMINAIRWNATGRDITRGVCAALRARECIEADPAIIDAE